jgi:GrpB-like predicted nucleotidyltransferase (UPF0157 family)
MIEIVDYQPTWPADFATLAGALRRALGSHALRIDHIGSTSVPGLPAKDVIDMQVTVAGFESFAPVEAALAELGYSMVEHIQADHQPGLSHLPPDLPYDPQWEKRYFRPPAGQRPTHLHVRAQGRANQRYALLFRDYLRAHAAAATGYAIFKRRLALLVGEDRALYADTKDPVCDIIMAGAEAWAAATGWQPGPSDG